MSTSLLVPVRAACTPDGPACPRFRSHRQPPTVALQFADITCPRLGATVTLRPELPPGPPDVVRQTLMWTSRPAHHPLSRGAVPPSSEVSDADGAGPVAR